MPKFPIDLGRKSQSMGCPCVETSKPDEKYYPTLYLDWDDDYELPESGTMVVKFIRTRETNTTEKSGKKTQSVSLDIKKIVSVKGDKPKMEDEEEDSGKVLDKLKEESDDGEDY